MTVINESVLYSLILSGTEDFLRSMPWSNGYATFFRINRLPTDIDMYLFFIFMHY